MLALLPLRERTVRVRIVSSRQRNPCCCCHMDEGLILLFLFAYKAFATCTNNKKPPKNQKSSLQDPSFINRIAHRQSLQLYIL